MPALRKRYRTRRFARRGVRRYIRRRFYRRRGRRSSFQKTNTLRFLARSYLPDEFVNKLQWNFFVNWGPGSTFNTWALRANAPYLPDATGTTTTQPYGFDVLTGIYLQYTVTGCTFELTAENLTDNTSLQFAILPSTNITTYSSINDVLCDPRCSKLKTCAAESAGGNHIVRFKGYTTTSAMESISRKAVLIEDDYAGTATTAPAKVWYWFIYANSTGAATISTKMNMKLTYYIRWNYRVNSLIG